MKKWETCMIIIPAYPRVNIYSIASKMITALGPVMIASIIERVWGFRAVVIDENNYHGPKDKNGLPDHQVLLQEFRPSVVGFYCGMTCTIERVWKLARFYKECGCMTIAGAWHAKDCLEETLSNGIDVVFHSNEEIAVRDFFSCLATGNLWHEVPGIAFMDERRIQRNASASREVLRGYDPSMDCLPYPNFGLVRYARIRELPIRRVRGCSQGCEFCRVREIPRWASPQHLFDTVNYLVDTRKAREFFLVDDRSEEDRAGTLEFFSLIKERYGRRLKFGVQTRIDVADDEELSTAMYEAGVEKLYIGFESPIDEDLKAIGKGYSSSDMIRWTRKLKLRFRWIHAMLIAMYPGAKMANSLSANEVVRRYKQFIKRSGVDSIQVLLPGPIVKTKFRARMQSEGRILPLEVAPWSDYDGTKGLIVPDNLDFRGFQEIPLRLMNWFYSPFSLHRLSMRIFYSAFDFLAGGWERFKGNWLRELLKWRASGLLRKREDKNEEEEHIREVEAFLQKTVSNQNR